MYQQQLITNHTQEEYLGPNPSYPFPINNVTGENEIIVENKNLIQNSSNIELVGQTSTLIDFGKDVTFEDLTLSFYMKNARFSNTGNIVNFKKNDNTNKYISSTDFDLKPNTLLNGQFSRTFNNITFRYLIFYNSGTAYCKFTQGICDIQLEQGLTATDYIPHEEQTVTFPLSQGQYMAEGDYLADNGIHHVMGRVVFDGSSDEVWSYVSSYNRFQVVVDDFISPGVATVANIICNKLIATAKNQIAFENNKISGSEPNEHRMMIRIDNTITTLEELRTWLSNNPITVQYELSQEVIEPYTQAQQEAWNEIQKLMSYKGETHISQENDNLPFNLKVVYRVDPSISKANTKSEIESIKARLELLES